MGASVPYVETAVVDIAFLRFRELGRGFGRLVTTFWTAYGRQVGAGRAFWVAEGAKLISS